MKSKLLELEEMCLNNQNTIEGKMACNTNIIKRKGLYLGLGPQI